MVRVFQRCQSHYKIGCSRWWSHVFNLPANFIEDIKDFMHRGRHGWAPIDAYDLFTYHSNLMVDFLMYFKKNVHGTPGDMTDREWEDSLNTMIHGFMSTFWNEENYSVGDEFERKKKKVYDALFEKGMEEFTKNYKKLWF